MHWHSLLWEVVASLGDVPEQQRCGTEGHGYGHGGVGCVWDLRGLSQPEWLHHLYSFTELGLPPLLTGDSTDAQLKNPIGDDEWAVFMSQHSCCHVETCIIVLMSIK